MRRAWIISLMFCSALFAQVKSKSVQPLPPARAIQVTGKVTSSERRIALVIGNSAYRDAPLANPVYDARDMAELLRKCGFTVTKLENATRDQFATAIRNFGDDLLAGGVGLFYYAGHGMQVRGKNYLIPVNADILREDEVPYQALDADAVLAKMETARNRLNIVILDACRNNPFGRSFRSGSQGLAQMEAPKGTFVAFATAPGRTASDGSGRNGLYTRYLLENLTVRGQKLEDLFKRVRSGVLKDSAEQQMPWDSSSLMGDFYFVPVEGTPATAPVGTDAVSTDALELTFWNSIKDGTRKADFEEYLKRFPEGTFAGLARNRIAALNPPPLPGPMEPFPDDQGRSAYFGVVIQELNEDLHPIFGVTEGALITDIQQASPAEKAGLKPLDVITSLEGRKVAKASEVADWVKTHRKGDTARVAVLREKKTFEVTVVLASRSTVLIAAKQAPELAEGQRQPAEMQAKAAEMPSKAAEIQGGEFFAAFFGTKTPFGFSVGDLTEQQRQESRAGVAVVAVDDKGPAKDFLFPGDVILAVLGEAGRVTVKDPAGFLGAAKAVSGKALGLLVRRADSTFVLTLPSAPSGH